MKKIEKPNGDVVSLEDIKIDLKQNGILFKPINKEVYDYIDNIYSSYLQKNIIASRYDSKDQINKYMNTSLKTLLSTKFIEEHIPDITTSSEILLDTIKNNGFILHISDYDMDF